MTVIETGRLRLRPFEPGDAPAVHELCSAREIAAGTLLIPHPYTLEDAETFVASAREDTEFAITVRGDGTLVGAIALEVEPDHDRADLGCWIGVPHWGHGYATEATAAVIGYAFDELGLNRVYASCFTRNTVSRRVLEKAGMVHEGTHRQDVVKWGEHLDCESFGILRDEWRDLHRGGTAGPHGEPSTSP